MNVRNDPRMMRPIGGTGEPPRGSGEPVRLLGLLSWRPKPRVSTGGSLIPMRPRRTIPMTPVTMQQHSGTSTGIVKVVSFASLGSWAGSSDASNLSRVTDAMQKQVLVEVLVLVDVLVLVEVLVLVDVEVVVVGGAGGVVVVCVRNSNGASNVASDGATFFSHVCPL